MPEVALKRPAVSSTVVPALSVVAPVKRLSALRVRVPVPCICKVLAPVPALYAAVKTVVPAPRILRVEAAELTTPPPPIVSVAPERLLMRERLAPKAKAAVALPSSMLLVPWKMTGLPPITTGLAMALAPVRAVVAESVPPLKLNVCVFAPPKRLVVRPRIKLP